MTLAYGAQQPCDSAQLRAVDRRCYCPQRDKPWVLATAVLGSSLAFIEGSAVNLALPAIQADVQTSSTNLQWVINAYLLVLGSFMLIGGSLGDRYGLRRVFVLGASIFGLGALACGLAGSLFPLLLARMIQGFGGALLVPSSLALIGQHFSAEERGRAIGIWAGASALTTAAGPLLGGWLVDQFGWPAVFFVVPPLVALTVAIALWRVPAGSAQNDQQLDYPGALLLIAALACLIYALVDGGAVAGRFALAVLAFFLGIAFLWRERHYHSPMLPLGLFRSRSFSGANLMTLMLYCALSGALYFLPFNLIQIQGYSALQAGAAFLPMTLMLGFGSTLAGDLIRRFDPRVILTLGPIIAGAGFMALAIPGANSPFVTGFLPGILIIGVGMTLSVAPLTTVVMNAVSEKQAGIAAGVNNTAARLAGVVAVSVLTAIAVAYFSTALATQLEIHQVSPQLSEQLLQQTAQLAELQPPSTASGQVADSIIESVRAAYVAMFRTVVIICAVLAALSGLIAWLTLAQPNSPQPHPLPAKP